MNIGVIGLGSMGGNMALNLINKGHAVWGCDKRPEAMAALKAAGGRGVSQCGEIGACADTVILMVFDAAQVEDVLFGAGNLCQTMRPGSTVIVTASVGAPCCRDTARRLEQMGLHLLDAPLMGSCETALSGELHMIVSGPDDLFQRHLPLLQDMGTAVYHVGSEPGMGQKAKSCIQMLFSLTFETAFEVTALAQKSGLAMDEVVRLLQASPAFSPVFQEAASNALSHRYTGTNNPLSILDKDIRLALALADEVGITPAATQGTARVFAEAMEHDGDEDVWAAAKVVHGK